MTAPNTNDRDVLGDEPYGPFGPGSLPTVAPVEICTCPVCGTPHCPQRHGASGEFAPDVLGAISLELQAAGKLVGNDTVVNFFQDQIGAIIAHHFPLDVGGMIRAKCQADVGELINKLLSQ